jgi:hypothetical protein
MFTYTIYAFYSRKSCLKAIVHKIYEYYFSEDNFTPLIERIIDECDVAVKY